MKELEIKGKEIFTSNTLPEDSYIKAIEICRQFEDKDEWRRFSLQVKGVSLWKLGYKKRAHDVFLTLIRETVPAFNTFSSSFEFIDSNYEEIKESWNSIFTLEGQIKKEPKNITYLKKLRDYYVWVGFFDKSIYYSKKYLAIKRDDEEGWHSLAEMYEAIGKKKRQLFVIEWLIS